MRYILLALFTMLTVQQALVQATNSSIPVDQDQSREDKCNLNHLLVAQTGRRYKVFFIMLPL